jgi:hypothetical protein
VAAKARFTSKSVFRQVCIAYQPSATADMTEANLLPFDLSAVRRKKLTVDFGGGNQSLNGGLLLLRSAERKLGLVRAACRCDARSARREPHPHAMFEMVMARVCAIACGHEDAIDLDRLRHDPMKVARALSAERCAAGLAIDEVRKRWATLWFLRHDQAKLGQLEQIPIDFTHSLRA